MKADRAVGERSAQTWLMVLPILLFVAFSEAPLNSAGDQRPSLRDRHLGWLSSPSSNTATFFGVFCMKFLARRLSTLDYNHKANGTAFVIAMGVMLFLQLESAPRPAGADTVRATSSKTVTPVVAQAVGTPVSDENLTPEQRLEKGIRRKLEVLEKGVSFLEKVPDYTAMFARQELVNGKMLEEQTMQMKIQHSPFSVYMKWEDFEPGRELIYVEGSNDGKMVVHPGGWKSRLPTMTLEPDNVLAMQESRHPVTNVGLLNLARKIISFHRRDLESHSIVKCEQAADLQINGRDCMCFITEYKNAQLSKDYRKSITFIDKEWSLPLFIKNFGWPNEGATETGDAMDEATLVEQYSYSDVRFRANLTAMDFDRTNEDYTFKR